MQNPQPRRTNYGTSAQVEPVLDVRFYATELGAQPVRETSTASPGGTHGGDKDAGALAIGQLNRRSGKVDEELLACAVQFRPFLACI